MKRSRTAERFERNYRPRLTPENEEEIQRLSALLDDLEDLDSGAIAARIEARIADEVEDRYPFSQRIEKAPPRGWPVLRREAFHGLAGEVAQAFVPYSEAPEEAVLADFLTTFGVMVGPGPTLPGLGATVQTPRLFVVVVGASADARKGASRSTVETVTADADHVTIPGAEDLGGGVRVPWAAECTVKGLGSGEALVESVETLKRRGSGGRTLVLEPEFARLLHVASRDGSTLSPIIRDAWDSSKLAITTRRNAVKTEEAYIGIIAHITVEELRKFMANNGAVEVFNGFGNRFLYVPAQRRRVIPFVPGGVPAAVVDPLTQKTRRKAARARNVREMELDRSARNLWKEWAIEAAEEDRRGTFGALTRRQEPHTARLAMLYALLDGTSTIRRQHLEAARAVADYSADAISFLFGQGLGDPKADLLLDALKAAMKEKGTGLTRTQRSKLQGRNADTAELDRIDRILLESGLAEMQQEKTGGRPRAVMVYVGPLDEDTP